MLVRFIVKEFKINKETYKLIRVKELNKKNYVGSWYYILNPDEVKIKLDYQRIGLDEVPVAVSEAPLKNNVRKRCKEELIKIQAL